MKKYGFAIIGAGNLGTRLAIALKSSGLDPGIIISRNPEKAASLALLLDCMHSTEYVIPEKVNIVFICTSDKNIRSVIGKLKGNGKVVVHCSGSTSMDVFKGKIDDHGVFYPLQTFTADEDVDFRNIPLLLEASGNRVLGMLREIGQRLSGDVQEADSRARLRCHIAAVFAANFTTHLIYIGEELLKESGIPARILHPLLNEMTRKVCLSGAYRAQTGPARRNDQLILDTHLKELESDPSLQKLYIFVSDRIRKTYTG